MAVHEHREKGPKTVGLMVMTISDSRTEETDYSGQLIKEHITKAQHRVVDYCIVRDEPDVIEPRLRGALQRSDIDVILLNGGTGISPRDQTYEVVTRMLEKRLDGFGEIFRFLSFQDIGSAAIMSRAVAGIAQGKVIMSMPGSRGGVDLAMRRLILPELGHLVAQVKGS